MKLMSKTAKAIAVSLGALMLSGAGLAANSIAGATGATSIVDKRPLTDASSIAVGAYDPHGDFSADRNVAYEHLFLPWEDIDLSSLAVADQYAAERGRGLIITVEPWSWSVDRRQSSGKLLKGILAGKYDANMGAICSASAALKSPVIIRWAQEMDETDNQFTWAKWAPSDYVSAYRRMVTECRRTNTTAHYMWSPKGNASLAEFYPGDAFVDVVGLTVFGLQQYDLDKFGHERSFAEALSPGYHRVEQFGKPVMVAELGYEGDRDYVRKWAETVAKPNAEFPRLTAVVYFNDREVYPWPDHYGLPDWRVTSVATN